MISVTVNESNELVITGEMAVGDKVPNRCCVGFDWEVAEIFGNANPEYVSLWGFCHNEQCPNGGEDHWKGVSNTLVIDLADWMADKQAVQS